MASGLDRLKELSPPPPSGGAQPDWQAAEEAVGSALPTDYKQLVKAYGPGSFDDFIWILQPMHDNRHLDLVHQRDIQLDALRTLRAGGEEIPFDVDAGEEELLPWAITDNGDVVYWLRRPGQSPDEWPVAINAARDPRWEQYDGSATEFLADVLSKKRRLSVFPEDVPSDDPAFVPSGRGTG